MATLGSQAINKEQVELRKFRSMKLYFNFKAQLNICAKIKARMELENFVVIEIDLFFIVQFKLLSAVLTGPY